jgi:hypothetical protein
VSPTNTRSIMVASGDLRFSRSKPTTSPDKEAVKIAAAAVKKVSRNGGWKHPVGAG